MHIRITNILKAPLFSVISLLLLSACGLPDQLEQEAKQVPSAIASLRQQQESAWGEISGRLSASGDSAFLSRYANQERWAQTLQEIKASLEQSPIKLIRVILGHGCLCCRIAAAVYAT